MTYYYQFIFLLLAAGHIYCLQEFPLKDGNILELSWTKKFEKDTVLNGTHIKKLFSYNVKGFTKTNDTRQNSGWSANILSVSELPLNNRHHHVKNCNVYLNPPYRTVSEDMFEALQKYIWNDICENSTTTDRKTIDLYEDKNNDLKNSVINQSKYMQARDGFDTVFDAALLLARKKLEINDFIDLPPMGLGGLKLIKDVTLGNLSTIARARSVKISNNSDVLAINVLVKMEPQINFTVATPYGLFESAAKMEVHAPKTVAGATIKLDYSKEKCQIEVGDVELDFNHSLRVNFLDALLNLASVIPISVIEVALQPVLIKPQMKTYLEYVLNEYLNCEDLRTLYRW